MVIDVPPTLKMLDVLMLQVSVAASRVMWTTTLADCAAATGAEDYPDGIEGDLRGSTAKLLQLLGLLSETFGISGADADDPAEAGAPGIEPTEEETKDPGELEYLNDRMALATAHMPEAEPPPSVTAKLWFVLFHLVSSQHQFAHLV